MHLCLEICILIYLKFANVHLQQAVMGRALALPQPQDQLQLRFPRHASPSTSYISTRFWGKAALARYDPLLVSLYPYLTFTWNGRHHNVAQTCL